MKSSRVIEDAKELLKKAASGAEKHRDKVLLVYSTLCWVNADSMDEQEYAISVETLLADLRKAVSDVGS